MNEKHCFKNFADIKLTLDNVEEYFYVSVRLYFNAYLFSFEQEETEEAFSHASLLTEIDRRHIMTKCKAFF